MKQLYRKLFFVACSISLAICSFSQDIHFSQFFEAPLYRNPALAGIVNGDVRVQTVYRSQWNSIANAYKTTSLNAEYKLPVTGDDYLTVGLQVFHDKSGSTNLTTTHVLPALNYHKSLSSEKNMYLSLGFTGGYVQRSVDRSQMTTNSTYEGHGDGESALLQTRYGYMDGSAGISFNTQLSDNPENNLVIGAAYHHFNRPKNSFFNNESVAVQPKMVFSADAKFAMGEEFVTTFYNDFVTQGAYRETMSGMLLGYKVGPYSDTPDAILRAGGFLRWGDAFIPVVQLDYRTFSVSLSYDVNLSKLSTTSYGRGGYELSVTYAGFLDRENSSANAVRCPHF
ncbi:PorP/SprF family type IX secretion system membrane protein [Flavisolibacter nicotianae]|uniref:PorP/SprF family type IX secretion system membrane protein n=1 Tax=Flavisolibacter nicotianae TaxID=2364882 RepID=UPI000EB4879E|nr:PorP/SprF family type IX secretion system membrane protein [Flavisolibacter nicotianae]